METGSACTFSSPVIYPSVHSHTDGRIETGRLQYEAVQCPVAAVAPSWAAKAPVGKWSADRVPYLVLHAFSDSNRGRRQNRAEVLRLPLRSPAIPSLGKPPRSNFMGHDAVSEMSVFDLGEEAPDKVLHRLYANFEKLKSDGDGLAEHIERTLRLIVRRLSHFSWWFLELLQYGLPMLNLELRKGGFLHLFFILLQAVASLVACGSPARPRRPRDVAALAARGRLSSLHGETKGTVSVSTKCRYASTDRNIAQLANVKIMRRPGHWEDLRIPRRLTWSSQQARRIRFEFHKGAADHTFMRIDGEPWKQPLPVDDNTVVVEISHLGQVKMLATHNCISKSINDPSTPSSASHRDDEDSNLDSEDEWEGGRSKFGAAETFKIPEDTDIAHLS
ncbi:hypothetical protein GW17_00009853 [Ensete ventricosum]|nr:hypothetical protein GW17_00009853 [Ensete ventricosum]